jgi:hypothetical protein
MEIKDLYKEESHILEIEDGPYKEWPTYRRTCPGCWEVLMGSSWEDISHTRDIEPLEAAFQEYIFSRVYIFKSI